MSEDKTNLLRSLSIDRAEGEAGEAAPRGLPLVPAAIGAAVLLLLGGALGWFLRPAPPPPEAPPLEASGEASRTGSVARGGGLAASGYVVARRRATVAAEVTGRVLEVRVEEGQIVKKGDVLAVLDATLARADSAAARSRINAAEASIRAFEADLAEAQRNLERTRTLAESKFASDAALKSAIARVDSLSAQLSQARAQAATTRLQSRQSDAQLSRYEIRAPFSGVVIDKAAQPGEIISPVSAGGGFTRTGICTIVDMDSLEIEVDVNEAFIARVSEGQKVEAVLDAYPDVVFPARVIATIPTASRDKATVRVRIGFDELDPRILPEMAIKVTFLENDG